MRTVLLSLLAASTVLALPAAAQAAPAGSALTTRQIVPGVRVKLSAADRDDFKGQYDLADGRTLTVSGDARRLLAQLDSQPALEIEALAGAQFVAREGGLRLQFEQHANGSVSGVNVIASR
ncbi:MAG: hypothetical protein V4508_21775 [Pseudomonadota bacterium]